MSVAQLWEDIEGGKLLLLDIRPLPAYNRGHVPGAISAPYKDEGWAPGMANWLEQNSTAFCLYADDSESAAEAARALEDHRVSPALVWDKGSDAWKEEGGPIAVVKEITVDELNDTRDSYVVIDVREPYEWRAGTIPGALKIALGELSLQSDSLNKGRQYALVCAHGNRSQKGAAFLADRGFDVSSVVGGMKVWRQTGHPMAND